MKKAKQASARGVCPIARAQFHDAAQPLSTKVGDVLLSSTPRMFSSGTLGWYGNGESTIAVDGVDVPVKIQVQVWIKQSKHAA